MVSHALWGTLGTPVRKFNQTSASASLLGEPQSMCTRPQDACTAPVAGTRGSAQDNLKTFPGGEGGSSTVLFWQLGSFAGVRGHGGPFGEFTLQVILVNDQHRT